MADAGFRDGAVNVVNFGATGDGTTDDAPAIQEAIDSTHGALFFPAGEYRLNSGLKVHLARRGRTYITSGGARLLNASGEPALHVAGTHEGTASPQTVSEHTFRHETMPLISALEIVGLGDCGDGIVLEKTYKAVVSNVLVRDCRHGIRLAARNRDVIIAQCHIMHNRDIGVFYDNVSLHQSNIVGCHICYNGHAGIKVADGDIRNLQITGNDIEYNNSAEDGEVCADVWFDAGAGTGTGIRESTICSNTIQATRSPNGANIRLVGPPDSESQKVGLISIGGNLITNQEYNIWAARSRAVAISANTLLLGPAANIRLQECRSVTLSANVIDDIPDYSRAGGTCGGIVLEQCEGCAINAMILRGIEAPDDGAALFLQGCRECGVTASQVLECRSAAVELRECINCRVSSNILGAKGASGGQPVREIGGSGNVVCDNLEKR